MIYKTNNLGFATNEGFSRKIPFDAEREFPTYAALAHYLATCVKAQLEAMNGKGMKNITKKDSDGSTMHIATSIIRLDRKFRIVCEFTAKRVNNRWVVKRRTREVSVIYKTINSNGSENDFAIKFSRSHHVPVAVQDGHSSELDITEGKPLRMGFRNVMKSARSYIHSDDAAELGYARLGANDSGYIYPTVAPLLLAIPHVRDQEGRLYATRRAAIAFNGMLYVNRNTYPTLYRTVISNPAFFEANDGAIPYVSLSPTDDLIAWIAENNVEWHWTNDYKIMFTNHDDLVLWKVLGQ